MVLSGSRTLRAFLLQTHLLGYIYIYKLDARLDSLASRVIDPILSRIKPLNCMHQKDN